MAKISGIVGATAVFAPWFYLIGIALAAGGGLWARRATDKWLNRGRDGEP